MQLDTGAGISKLYRDALPRQYSRLLKPDTLLIRKFSFSEPSSRIFELMYAVKKDRSKNCSNSKKNILVGTLANDYFLGGNLSLDLARTTFKYTRGAFRKTEGKNYTSIEINISKIGNHGSFPMAILILGNGEKRKMVFDTGSVIADLVVLQEGDWLKLVGLKKIDDVKPKFIPRWGQSVPCYFAPIVESVSLGSMILNSKNIAVYCHDPRAIVNIKNPIFGFIGLAPFGESVVTIDYVLGRLFIELDTAKN
ncbi:hypothetical protein [Janthinobacterium sp. BJB401]|uniref:hypothetical protein n=1 Tax=Janthinobacterium sp. BJB401 TaxID=2745934 RepID=UPI0015956516|nr:hypothetical protein [Janthinobacterium sp. BJB401]NVI84314.1 hypothetical protein [Janthinobacterium sp. BJB401]